MRGLLRAGLLLVPALASAFVVPEKWTAEKVEAAVHSEHSEHISSACVDVHVPMNPQSESADFGSNDSIQFCLNVMPSKQNCGIANVAVNDQILFQDTSDNGHSIGKGSIISDNRGIIVANWDFECVPIGDEFTVQLLKFTVEYVDGKAVENIGFTAAFTQAGEPQINRLDAGITEEDSATYVGEISLAFIPHDTIVVTVEDFEDINIEEEMAELELMKAEARHIRHLIHEKERFIHRLIKEEGFEADIQECDSLKCVIKFTISKVRNAAHGVLSKVAGVGPHHDEDFEIYGEPAFGHKSHHGPPPPCKGKHHGPPPPAPPRFPHFDKSKNGSHNHGNETHPHPPPPPPGFCHCPPPPHHGGHPYPPPHGKPGKGKGPKGKKPHGPGKPPGDHEGHPPPPPPAGKPEAPKGDHHGPPPKEGEHGPDGEHHGPPPPFDGEHRRPEGEHHGPPPPFNGEHEGEHHEHHGPPPPFSGEHHGPEDEHLGPPPPFDGEHHGPEDEHHGPPPPFGGEHHGSDGEHHGPPPPFNGEHEGEHHEHHGPPPPFDGEHHGPEGEHHGPPPPFNGEHEEEHHEHHGTPPPFDGEHHGPEGEHHGPPPPFGGEHHGPDGEHHGPPPPFNSEHEGEHHEHHGPPPFDGEHHEHHGHEEFSQGFEGHHRPSHHGPPPHMMVLKFSAIGFALAFLVISLYRRCCTPRSRAARQARREERHRRRAYRRAEHRNSLRSFFENLVKSQAEKDHEEKMALMETDRMEEVMRFRSGVIDIVAAEEGRFTDDELPAYEDAESCDGLVADGMLYEPGSEYTPGSSDAGSLHEVLGVKAPVDTDKSSA